jgi:hypothetical protein
MDRTLASTRLYSVASPDNRPRSPSSAWSTHEAVRRQTTAGSAAGLLLPSLGVWAAVWATLASVYSWLR